MQISKQKELEKILTEMAILLTPNITKSPVKHEVCQFLGCAYGLFSSWKSKFNPSLIGTYNADKFWTLFEDFLDESNNGSWSQMARGKDKIKKDKVQLFSSVKQLLTNGSNLGEVVRIIKNVTSESSANKILGLTPFKLSGILFAHDENNYMILDNPVTEYFGYKDPDQALLNYKNIIDTSRSYSKKFNLSMWHINKGYGILSNEGKIVVKKLNGNCRSEKSKNFEYSF